MLRYNSWARHRQFMAESREGIAGVGAQFDKDLRAQCFYEPEGKGDMTDPRLGRHQAHRLPKQLLTNLQP